MMLFAFDLHVACTCILQVGKGPSIYDVCAGGEVVVEKQTKKERLR